jgi:hypothetical protein
MTDGHVLTKIHSYCVVMSVSQMAPYSLFTRRLNREK